MQRLELALRGHNEEGEALATAGTRMREEFTDAGTPRRKKHRNTNLSLRGFYFVLEVGVCPWRRKDHRGAFDHGARPTVRDQTLKDLKGNANTYLI